MLKPKGFTLIELLVVISIIGLLSSIVFASLNSARAKSRDVRRRADLNQMRTALEFYSDANGQYPSTSGLPYAEGSCVGTTVGWTVQPDYIDANAYIPNLAPTFMQRLPGDPAPNPSLARCYVYISNGTDYIIWAHQGLESAFNPNDSMVRLIAPSCTTAQATLTFSNLGRCN